jgi:hypothetical protein
VKAKYPCGGGPICPKAEEDWNIFCTYNLARQAEGIVKGALLDHDKHFRTRSYMDTEE